MTEPNSAQSSFHVRLIPNAAQQTMIGFLLVLTLWTGFWMPPHALADMSEDAATGTMAAVAAVAATQGERRAAKQVRELGQQMTERIEKPSNAPVASQQGHAFENLDAMKQQVDLGGKAVVSVPKSQGDGSPDIIIQDRKGQIIEQQQLKLDSTKARNAYLQAERGEKYSGMTIRTPSGQAPKPGVVQSGISRTEIRNALNNPAKATAHYARQADLKIVTKGVAAGAITGVATTAIKSGLRNGLAAQRGELDTATAIANTVLDTTKTVIVTGLIGGATAAVIATASTVVPTATGIVTGTATAALAVLTIPFIALDAVQTARELKSIRDEDQARRQELQKSTTAGPIAINAVCLRGTTNCPESPARSTVLAMQNSPS